MLLADFRSIKCGCHGAVVQMKNTMCADKRPTNDLSLSRAWKRWNEMEKSRRWTLLPFGLCYSRVASIECIWCVIDIGWEHLRQMKWDWEMKVNQNRARFLFFFSMLRFLLAKWYCFDVNFGKCGQTYLSSSQPSEVFVRYSFRLSVCERNACDS